MSVRLFNVGAVALIIACAALLRTERHAPEAPPTRPPPAQFARLIRAGNTLYWTVNQGDEHSVYAMTPRRHPRLLYRERGEITFGALAPPPHLAVAIDEPATGAARIQVLPRWPGTPARSLPAPRPIGDLLTDGAQLLWADDRGVRAAPATGGPLRTLARDDGVGELALARGRLYYITGRTVRSLALSGGRPRTEVRTANNITALCVGDRIYWSELGVTVRSADRTHWTGVGGHYTTGISCAGGRLTWSDYPSRRAGCQVFVQQGATTTGFAAGMRPRDLHDNGMNTAYLNDDGPAYGPCGTAR